MEYFYLTELKQRNIITKYFQVDFVPRMNFKFLYVFLASEYKPISRCQDFQAE